MSFKETFDLNNGMASWPSFDKKPSIEKPVTFTPPPNIDYQEASYSANANFRNALDKYAAKHIADLEAISIKSIVEPKVFAGMASRNDKLRISEIKDDLLDQCIAMKKNNIEPHSVRMCPGTLHNIAKFLGGNIKNYAPVDLKSGVTIFGLKVVFEFGMAGFVVEGDGKKAAQREVK